MTTPTLNLPTREEWEDYSTTIVEALWSAHDMLTELNAGNTPHPAYLRETLEQSTAAIEAARQMTERLTRYDNGGATYSGRLYR